jgi:hypothetical protein
MAVLVLPILVIIAIIVAVVVYMKTKSWAKVGYVFEIIFALAVFALSSQLVDGILIVAIDLLGLGLLINGIISLAK